MSELGANGPIVVVGGGQAGSLLALYLAHQGHEVEVYESRPDLRRVDIDAGRSINLALATRGFVALGDVGLAETVDAITVPMAGRMVHADGEVTFQPYGLDSDDVIHSVSRSDLNAILLDAAEATGRVTTHFEHWCHRIDFDRMVLTFSPFGAIDDVTEVPFGTVFGCDGANSEIREDVLRANGGHRTIEPLDHGYKELTLPPSAGGGFRIDPHGLHIWPRGEFMLIALANPEGDFTVTLFMPNTGPDSFETLVDADAIEAFFTKWFPDFAPLVPDLAQQFLTNPTGSLATVRTTGWSVDDRALLVGDAAHAIVPFHGQGMNLAMESCRLLDRELRRSPDDIAAAFASFEANRKPDADAIADMALENYVEMRAGVIDPAYLLARELALELERRHPDRVAARYGMVMFTTMPYGAVKERAERQKEVYTALTTDITALDDVDFELAARLVDQLGPLPEWQ
ncbi:MAG: FAD-dependent monooxygenase [Acidimicrobiia bacterium]|nr:FAD-dependent monooxygenase [Acidimicrobiia bacterium]